MKVTFLIDNKTESTECDAEWGLSVLIETEGRKILMAVALMQPFQNQQFITNGGLRGAGDTKFSAFTIMVTVLIVRTSLGILFINYLDFGLWGAWIALVTDQLLRTAMIIGHYNTGKWRFLKLKGQPVPEKA